MGITRIVQLQFKSATSHDEIEELSSKIRNMKNECLDPDSKLPYIQSIEGGAEISLEGLQHGITHAFIIKFNNIADRDYYAQKDPSHQIVIGALQSAIDKVQIIDLESTV